MRFEVVLTEDAERDPEDIVAPFATHDSPRNAAHVLGRMLEVAESLAAAPTLGSELKELSDLGHQEFRQVLFRPYRLIYLVVERVAIDLIGDGRRDIQTLLTPRLRGGA
jgi:toxin ParE1/3/4